MSRKHFECLTGYNDDGSMGIECAVRVNGEMRTVISIEGRSLDEVLDTLLGASAEAHRMLVRDASIIC